jgi:hypothetical protein
MERKWNNSTGEFEEIDPNESTPPGPIQNEDVPWSEAPTLEEWIISQFEKGRARSKEVQTMAKIYGVERFREIYVNWRFKQKK